VARPLARSSPASATLSNFPLVRALFVIYLTGIVSTITYFTIIGLTHH
jgi:hypothetical protein